MESTTRIAPFDPPETLNQFEQHQQEPQQDTDFGNLDGNNQQGQNATEIMFPADSGIKRTLCKFFEAGTCTKDTNCGFAHGDEELGQPVPRAAIERQVQKMLEGRTQNRNVG